MEVLKNADKRIHLVVLFLLCFDFSFFSLPTYNDCLDSFPQTRIQRLPSLLLCISLPPLCEMLFFGATSALIFFNFIVNAPGASGASRGI